MSPSTRVAVVGSANMDLVATAPSLPRPGETVLGNDFTMVPGGKGANQAIAAARAGARCAVIAAIGSDAFGVTLKARLTASGVDTTHLRVEYGASGVAVIVVDAAGENSIVATPGANAALTTLRPAELAAISDADVLVCQLEIPLDTVTQAARAARAAGTRVVLNAAPARALPAELLAAVDLLVVNEVEAQELTGRGRHDPAALLASVPRAVLTLGAKGAWYGDRDGAAELVAPPAVRSVDSTAAGDAFTGALAVAWGEGRPILDAVRWACAAGAACVRRLGSSNALPQRHEIDELFTATY
jgi:ribokinase